MSSSRSVLLSVFILVLSACSQVGNTLPQQYASATPVLSSPTPEQPLFTVSPSQIPTSVVPLLPSATNTQVRERTDPVPTSVSPTSTPVPTSSVSIPPVFYEPAGCQQPPDDYALVSVNNVQLNQRTYEMLQTAAKLYNGEIDVTGTAIMAIKATSPILESSHGSTPGGVVEISVTHGNGSMVLYAEVEPLVRALRTAGFAAWLWDEASAAVPAGSTPRIHAVSIGDKTLGSDEVDQLTGDNGYFRGYSGAPGVDGNPLPDRHGGLVLCEWMVAAGYGDLRVDKQTNDANMTAETWQDRLRQASLDYLADSAEKAEQVAHRLKYVDGKREAASLMCGPLAAAILRDAGLLPVSYGPTADLYMYWLADPNVDGRPWTLFPSQDYDLYHFDMPIYQFDFVSWPLRVGDFLFTYAIEDGFDHMFIVTEVDEYGRAYTVTNQYQPDHTYRIERLLLYDPADPATGVIQNQWTDPNLGRTGQNGFDVFRKKGTSLPPGSLYTYQVRPGDSLPTIAAHFYSTPEAIAAVNQNADLTHLAVGQTLVVPVNTTEIPALPRGGYSSLQARVEDIVRSAPSGQWGVYIENISSGEVVSINSDKSFHPASTIKLAAGIAIFNWLDRHPDIPITTSPKGETRSFEQLLRMMLIDSSEEATTALTSFLDSQPGYRVSELISVWGVDHTSMEPRQSTPADLALLWRRLYRGELLSTSSTQRLLDMLRRPSAGDELGIGGGLTESERMNLAHKNGMTFEDGLGVVADTGIIQDGGNAYVIVFVANQVNWPDFDKTLNLFSQITREAYSEFSHH